MFDHPWVTSKEINFRASNDQNSVTYLKPDKLSQTIRKISSSLPYSQEEETKFNNTLKNTNNDYFQTFQKPKASVSIFNIPTYPKQNIKNVINKKLFTNIKESKLNLQMTNQTKENGYQSAKNLYGLDIDDIEESQTNRNKIKIRGNSSIKNLNILFANC